MFSATLAPLKSIVSKPAWPSSVSLSSPGFQTKVSSPAPIRAVSLPSPPLIRSSPSLPTMTSSPRPPFIVSWMPSASSDVALIDVVAAQAVERQPVVGLLLEEDVDRGLQPEDVDPAGVARGAEDVGALGAVDGDRVGRAVAAAVRARAGRGRSASRRCRSGRRRRCCRRRPGPGSRSLSTSSRSIVTLATSRRNRTRPPLAEMSMFSLALEPKKSIVSAPSWPSMVSLPSPGSHWKTSSPAPMKATSLPLSPKTKSLPSPPRNTSAPCEPRSVSLPAPPSIVSLMTPAGSVVAVTPSLPPRALTTSESLAPFGVGDVHEGRQPEHGDRGARAEDVDDVVAVGAVDDDGVGRARRRPCRRSRRPG